MLIGLLKGVPGFEISLIQIVKNKIPTTRRHQRSFTFIIAVICSCRYVYIFVCLCPRLSSSTSVRMSPASWLSPSLQMSQNSLCAAALVPPWDHTCSFIVQLNANTGIVSMLVYSRCSRGSGPCLANKTKLATGFGWSHYFSFYHYLPLVVHNKNLSSIPL